jgi:hypothetical protein
MARRAARLLLLACIAVLAAASHAQSPDPSQPRTQTLYKLVDKTGKVTYVDKVPRGFDGEVTPIAIDPATNAASPARAAPARAEDAKDAKDHNTRRRESRDRLQAALDRAQAKLAAARKALAEGVDPLEDEYQVIQQKIDAANAKPDAPGPRSNCRRQGAIFVCPTIVPGERYRDRQAALEESVRVAEAELVEAERAFRRGTD